MKSPAYGSAHVEIITVSQPAKLVQKVGVRNWQELHILSARRPFPEAFSGHLLQKR